MYRMIPPPTPAEQLVAWILSVAIAAIASAGVVHAIARIGAQA